MASENLEAVFGRYTTANFATTANSTELEILPDIDVSALPGTCCRFVASSTD